MTLERVLNRYTGHLRLQISSWNDKFLDTGVDSLDGWLAHCKIL